MYVYIVKCVDNSYYTGYTNDVESRLIMHNSGKGARYTSGRYPSVVVWVERFKNKSEALRKEIEIKKFSRKKKEKLIFSVNSIWEHYKGAQYIIIGLIENLIVYSRLDTWKRYLPASKEPGEQYQVFLRDKSQWLDWIDKDKKLLRFNLKMAE